MKNMLLASATVVALMAATPVLAETHDHDATATGGHHEQAATGDKGTKDSGGSNSHVNVVRGGHDDSAGAGGSSGAAGVSVRPSGIATGAHFRADSTGGTGGSATGTSGSHKHGTRLSHQNGGDDNSGIIQHDTGKTANPLTGGSNMSQGSGGRHFGNTTQGAGSTANPLTGGSNMSQGSGGRHGKHGIISNTGGNANTNAMSGHGRSTNNTAAIFGIGGHGYKSTAQFGHSRHNSAFDSYRKAVHSSHRYHDGTYHRPSGWYEHTWNYGDFLPALFFADRYQIDDYDSFDLPDPPDGTVWVRYGSDALLVDDETGEIIQVVYGIFY